MSGDVYERLSALLDGDISAIVGDWPRSTRMIMVPKAGMAGRVHVAWRCITRVSSQVT
jgi:hypothetical protein